MGVVGRPDSPDRRIDPLQPWHATGLWCRGAVDFAIAEPSCNTRCWGTLRDKASIRCANRAIPEVEESLVDRAVELRRDCVREVFPRPAATLYQRLVPAEVNRARRRNRRQIGNAVSFRAGDVSQPNGIRKPGAGVSHPRRRGHWLSRCRTKYNRAVRERGKVGTIELHRAVARLLQRLRRAFGQRGVPADSGIGGWAFGLGAPNAPVPGAETAPRMKRALPSLTGRPGFWEWACDRIGRLHSLRVQGNRFARGGRAVRGGN